MGEVIPPSTTGQEGREERRIRELEDDLARARAAEQSERDRRLAAEESRDQWVSIARGQGAQAGQGALWGDPQLAIDAAYAAERRTRRRLEEQVSLVLQRDQTVEGLVRLVRLLPKLPVPVKNLHPDVASALLWALGPRTTILDSPAMASFVITELEAEAEGWRAVLDYSRAQSTGDHAAADAAKRTAS